MKLKSGSAAGVQGSATAQLNDQRKVLLVAGGAARVQLCNMGSLKGGKEKAPGMLRRSRVKCPVKVSGAWTRRKNSREVRFDWWAL